MDKQKLQLLTQEWLD